MKTCKGFWEKDSWDVWIKGEPATSIEDAKLFDAVPLSEFEAYKTKVKQAIEARIKQEKKDKNTYAYLALESLKRELEL